MNLASAGQLHTAERTTDSRHDVFKVFTQHLPDTYYVPGGIAGTGSTGMSKKQIWSLLP